MMQMPPGAQPPYRSQQVFAGAGPATQGATVMHTATAAKPFAPNTMDDYAKMSEKQAQQYEARLAATDADIGGCYVHRMPGCGNCATGCSLNLQCGGGMFPLNSYLPFCLFVGCYSQGAPGTGWSNLKGDNHIYKIDASNGTLGCFFVGQGSPCCVCSKV